MNLPAPVSCFQPTSAPVLTHLFCPWPSLEDRLLTCFPSYRSNSSSFFPTFHVQYVIHNSSLDQSVNFFPPSTILFLSLTPFPFLTWIYKSWQCLRSFIALFHPSLLLFLSYLLGPWMLIIPMSSEWSVSWQRKPWSWSTVLIWFQLCSATPPPMAR